MNNVNHMLNNSRNGVGNEEHGTRVKSVALERRNDRELKHKVKLEEIKRGGSLRMHSTNVHGFGGKNDMKTKQMIRTID